jgi:hypothetical protein
MRMVYGCIREVNWPFTVINEDESEALQVAWTVAPVPVVGMINFLMRRGSR